MGLAALASRAEAGAAINGGGEAIVGLYANIGSLDPHFQVSHIAASVFFGLYEGLVTVDEDGRVIPSLAERWSSSPDGLAYRFDLRRGVRFHDGGEMTARDVVASLERYRRISPERGLPDLIERVDASSPQTVAIRLRKASATFLPRLASPANPVAIIPAHEAPKPLNQTANVGTGPFRLAEWTPDSQVRLRRFAGYSANTAFTGPQGLGGRRTAWLDTVTFRFMPEPSARVAALEAGDIHLAEQVPARAAARLARNPRLRIERLTDFNMPALFINHARAPTSGLALRRAVQAAVDVREAMAGATDGAYTLDPSWLWPNSPYYSKAGGELYGLHDLNIARRWLAEARYRGEAIDFLIPNISLHMKLGVILLEQLRTAGLNVRPVSVDFATMVATIASDRGWHLALNGFRAAPFLGPYAYETIFSGPNNWARAKALEDGPMRMLWDRFNAAPDDKGRAAAWAAIQALTYRNVTMVKLGAENLLIGMDRRLQGYRPYAGGERMWDVRWSPAGRVPS